MEFKNEDEAKRVAPFRPSGSSSQVRGTWAVGIFSGRVYGTPAFISVSDKKPVF